MPLIDQITLRQNTAPGTVTQNAPLTTDQIDSNFVVLNNAVTTLSENTQSDVNPTPNTLVRRDAVGGIQATNVGAQAINTNTLVAQTITTTEINATNFNGNATSASRLQNRFNITINKTGGLQGFTGPSSTDGTNDITFDLGLASSGVTPGTYNTVTVDTFGRVVAGTNASAANSNVTVDGAGNISVTSPNGRNFTVSDTRQFLAGDNVTIARNDIANTITINSKPNVVIDGLGQLQVNTTDNQMFTIQDNRTFAGTGGITVTESPQGVVTIDGSGITGGGSGATNEITSGDSYIRLNDMSTENLDRYEHEVTIDDLKTYERGIYRHTSEYEKLENTNAPKISKNHYNIATNSFEFREDYILSPQLGVDNRTSFFNTGLPNYAQIIMRADSNRFNDAFSGYTINASSSDANSFCIANIGSHSLNTNNQDGVQSSYYSVTENNKNSSSGSIQSQFKNGNDLYSSSFQTSVSSINDSSKATVFTKYQLNSNAGIENRMTFETNMTGHTIELTNSGEGTKYTKTNIKEINGVNTVVMNREEVIVVSSTSLNAVVDTKIGHAFNVFASAGTYTANLQITETFLSVNAGSAIDGNFEITIHVNPLPVGVMLELPSNVRYVGGVKPNAIASGDGVCILKFLRRNFGGTTNYYLIFDSRNYLVV